MSSINPQLRALGGAAASFQTYLNEAAKVGRLSREKIEQHGQALLTAAPPEARPSDAPRGEKAA